MKMTRSNLTYAGCFCFFAFLFLVAVKVLLLNPAKILERQTVDQTCLTRPVIDLEDLFKNWKSIWNNSRTECQRTVNQIETIFDLEIQSGSLKIPMKMESVVKDWLGHDEKLYRNFFNQTLLYVKNKIALTSTIRNPLRSSKPKQQRKGKIES